MNRSDIILRIIAVLIARGVAVGGSLVFGHQEFLDVLGIILGGLLLTGALAFIAFGAPFTLLAALILVPVLISWVAPNLPFVGAA